MKKPKVGLVRLSIQNLRPSPENDRLYRPVNVNDPEIIALAESIRQHGVREPLVVTADGYILSGHRRFAAAKLAGLKTVPCRVERFKRADDPDRYLTLLREHNRQREKSLDEKLREEIISADPDDSYATLTEYRRTQSQVEIAPLLLADERKRKRISKAKKPFLAAIRAVLEDRRKYWPLSDRAVHYALLNDPPLKHASKSDSFYANDEPSYKALVELLTRARIAGDIPMQAIHDPTRPVTCWKVHRESGAFIRNATDTFLQGYARDLMQSQPNHLEIVCEKNTGEPIVRAVAADYCIPVTSGRGYCSLPPRNVMAQRFRLSGKDKLILLLLSDFDPDGEEIAHSFARSMRDDFGISEVHAIKVALTGEQVQEYGLPPVMKAKRSSSQYSKFADRHGDNVFELEAIPPETLQRVLKGAIDNVIDLDAFNAEVRAERKDAQFLAGVRKTVLTTLQATNWKEVAE